MEFRLRKLALISPLALASASSVIQTLASGVLLFFLYRLMLDSLGSEQVGLWSTLVASVSVVRLSESGLGASVVKFVAESLAIDAPEAAAAVVQTVATSLAVLMGLFAVIVCPILTGFLPSLVPPNYVALAASTVPYALASVCVGAVANSLAMSLDGCHRIVTRNIVQFGGAALLVILSAILMPSLGLEGLLLAQLAQGLAVALASWLLLRKFLQIPSIFPFRWDRRTFGRVFSYSASFQISSIAILLFDPVTKLLLVNFSGLSSAGYFEMAAQLVQRVRQMFVAASQALVPRVAAMCVKENAGMSRAYIRASSIIGTATLCIYGMLLLLVPAASIIWLGSLQPKFVFFASVLVVAWGMNTVGIPAYMFSLGSGAMRWNVFSHVAITIANAVFGAAGAVLYGAEGIAGGMVVALTIGTVILVISGAKTHGVPILHSVPRPWFCVTAILGLCSGLHMMAKASRTLSLKHIALMSISLSVIYGAAIALALYWCARWVSRRRAGASE